MQGNYRQELREKNKSTYKDLSGAKGRKRGYSLRTLSTKATKSNLPRSDGWGGGEGSLARQESARVWRTYNPGRGLFPALLKVPVIFHFWKWDFLLPLASSMTGLTLGYRTSDTNKPFHSFLGEWEGPMGSAQAYSWICARESLLEDYGGTYGTMES